MEKRKDCKIFDKPFSKKRAALKGIYTDQHVDVMCVRFDEEDTMVAVGCSDGVIRLYNLNTFNKLTELSTNMGQEHVPTTSMRWRPVNQNNTTGSTILAASGSGSLYQFVAKTGKKIFEKKEEDNYIFAIDYNAKGTMFATAGKDCNIRLYDEETKDVAHELKGVTWHKPGHNNRLFGLRFNPDDANIILSGGWDQNVHIWDIRAGSAVGTICGPKICGDAIDVRGNYILTGAHRGNDQLQLWDYGSQKLVTTFQWTQPLNQQTNGFIFACQFNKTNGDYVCGGGANSVKIFDTKQDFRILVEAQVPQHSTVYSLDNGNFSNKLVFGCKSGHTYYLNINSHTQ